MTRVLMFDDKQVVVLYGVLREAYFEADHQIRLYGEPGEPKPEDVCCPVHEARWQMRKDVSAVQVRQRDEIQALRDYMGDPKEPRPEQVMGPDDGHTFRLTVSSRGSYSVVGDEHPTDALDFGTPWAMDVRAWNLPAALAKAAEKPLDAWDRGEVDG